MASHEEQRPTSSPVDEIPPSMPSWVKYLLLALTAAVLIAVLVMLAVGGDHGPSRHTGSQAPAGNAAPPVGT